MRGGQQCALWTPFLPTLTSARGALVGGSRLYGATGSFARGACSVLTLILMMGHRGPERGRGLTQGNRALATPPPGIQGLSSKHPGVHLLFRGYLRSWVCWGGESDPEQRGPRRYRFTDGQSGWSPTSGGDSLCPMGSSHVEEERQCWDSSLPGMPVSPPLPPGGWGGRTLLRVMPTDILFAKAESAVSLGKVGTRLTYDQCGLELPSIAPQGRA